METAFRTVAEKKGLCIIAGNLPVGETISINPFDLIKGRRIVGTWGGETKPDRDIPRYVQWYQEKRLKIDALASQVYSFFDINQTIEDFHAGRVVRALLSMGKGGNA
jgi:S-(hydroxymethyl)glutathione dehydrogenase/alcohol dehydrogenase